MRRDTHHAQADEVTNALLLTSAAACMAGILILGTAHADGRSVMGYYVFFISWPAWIVGAICAAVAASRLDRGQRTLARIAMGLVAVNITAALLSIVLSVRTLN